MWSRIRPALPVLVLSATLTAACAAEPPATPSEQTPPESTPSESAPLPAGDADPSAEDPAMTAAADADRALVPYQPVTLRLPLSEELLAVVRDHTETAGARTLRLTLEGLENPRAPISVRVFVNAAGADATTSIDDPHYLGDVGFYPVGDYGESATDDSSFLLDVGQVLAELPAGERLIDGRYVDVTLIAMPPETGGAEAAPMVEIPFDGVRLTAHDPPADD